MLQSDVISVQKVEEMTIESYNSMDHSYILRPRSGESASGIFISPTPTSNTGSGLLVAPKSGTECVVLRCGIQRNGTTEWQKNYILGYTTGLNSLGTRAGIMDNIKLKSGDAGWFGLAHTFIRQAKNGTLTFFANLWTRVDMSQVTQTLSMFLRNLKIRMRGGKVNWLTDMNLNTNLHAEIHDKYEQEKFNDVTGIGGSPDYANKIIINAGTLEEANILTIETRQDKNKDNTAEEFTKLKIGRPNEGALVERTLSIAEGAQELKERELVNADLAYDMTYVHGDNAASRTTAVDTKAGETIVVEYDNETVTESLGRGNQGLPLIKSQAVDKDSNVVLQEVLIDNSQMYKIDINNGKAKLEIDKEGNVKITSATEIIYLGGTNKEQQISTKSFVTALYDNHVHPTTSPGAPTLPPIIKSTMFPVIADNLSNIFTFTTKAE